MTRPLIAEALENKKQMQQEPDSNDWESLGYDSKQEAEESFHRLHEMPEEVPVPKAVVFEKTRKGPTVIEYGWKGDSMVVHLSWSPPPRLPPAPITDTIVLALHAATKGSVQAVVKPPAPPLDVDGQPIRGTMFDGNYTIILAMLKLRPGGESYFKEVIVPALLEINPHQPRTLRRLDPARKARSSLSELRRRR